LLFMALVVVFDKARERKWHFYSLGYGLPLVIAAVTIVVAAVKGDLYDGYFREDACWLDDNYLWAFMAPVSVVLALNTFILFKGMREAYKVSKKIRP